MTTPTRIDVATLPPLPDPYAGGNDEQHAGRVFVLTQRLLDQVTAVASDGANPTVLKDRLMLCLWDLRRGPSIWVAVQTFGAFEIAHEWKYLHAGTDDNWMDASKVSHYQDGTLWLLAGPRFERFRIRQDQERGVTIEGLNTIHGNISNVSAEKLLTYAEARR